MALNSISCSSKVLYKYELLCYTNSDSRHMFNGAQKKRHKNPQNGSSSSHIAKLWYPKWTFTMTDPIKLHLFILLKSNRKKSAYICKRNNFYLYIICFAIVDGLKMKCSLITCKITKMAIDFFVSHTTNSIKTRVHFTIYSTLKSCNKKATNRLTI